MDRHGVRYVFENKLLPKWFFEHKLDFVGLLLHEKEFLFESISKIFKQEEVENPYTSEMFQVSAAKITDQVLMLKISFPEPEEEPLCYCSYLFFDEAFEKISYFCIEKGNPESQMHPFVCAWTSDGSHHNYGNCTLTDHNDFFRCADIHMKMEYGLTRNTEGDI